MSKTRACPARQLERGPRGGWFYRTTSGTKVYCTPAESPSTDQKTSNQKEVGRVSASRSLSGAGRAAVIVEADRDDDDDDDDEDSNDVAPSDTADQSDDEGDEDEDDEHGERENEDGEQEDEEDDETRLTIDEVKTLMGVAGLADAWGYFAGAEGEHVRTEHEIAELRALQEYSDPVMRSLRQIRWGEPVRYEWDIKPKVRSAATGPLLSDISTNFWRAAKAAIADFVNRNGPTWRALIGTPISRNSSSPFQAIVGAARALDSIARGDAKQARDRMRHLNDLLAPRHAGAVCTCPTRHRPPSLPAMTPSILRTKSLRPPSDHPNAAGRNSRPRDVETPSRSL